LQIKQGRGGPRDFFITAGGESVSMESLGKKKEVLLYYERRKTNSGILEKRGKQPPIISQRGKEEGQSLKKKRSQSKLN